MIVNAEAGHGSAGVALVGVLGCVERVPCQTWFKWFIADSGDPVMWRRACWDVRPRHPLKYPRSMAWMREDRTG